MKERLQNYLRQYNQWLYNRKLGQFAANNALHEDISSHIIISGFYRGGTTWLAEALNKITGCPIIWEPFHKNISQERFKLGLDWKFCIEADEQAPEVKRYLDRVLTGKSLSRQLLWLTDLEKLQKSRSLIFKFCRLNMSLPWFIENYPECKVIYLVRNPYAVVASQLISPAWNKVFNDTFPVPSGLYTSAITEHSEYLLSLKSKHERLAADWSLDNMMLQGKYSSYLHHPNVHLVYYEDLLIQPAEEFRKIQAFYGLKTSKIDTKVFNKRSISSLHAVSQIEPLIQLNKWKEVFTPEQVDEMYAVTKYFGVDHLYGKSEVAQLAIRK